MTENRKNIEKETVRGILRKPGAEKSKKKVTFKKSKNRRGRKGKHKDKETIKILYANVNGIKGKINSLQTAAETHGSHVITIAETKQIPPKLEGYSDWMYKNRKDKGGGGVSIAVRDDLKLNTNEITMNEDPEQEIVWTEIKTKEKENIYVGVYYGKQEGKTPVETIENEFSQISTQITKLRQRGKVILTGDFNAKIHIEKGNVKQETSSNGKYLEDMLDNLNLDPVSVDSEYGTWTRENRNNSKEKSVIDYVIIPKEIKKNVLENIVDEKGVYRIKGKKETDHNTILVEIETSKKKETKKIQRWRLNNKEGWKEYNEKIRTNLANTATSNYEEINKIIKQTLEETVGKRTITTGKKKRRESERTKELKEKKKEAKKRFENTNKEDRNEKRVRLDEYVKCQIELRKEHEKCKEEEVRATLKKITEQGGTKSETFWKMRRKYLGGNSQTNYDTITEEGLILKTEEETKEHIAKYFEELYKAREGKEEYKAWTERIVEKNKEITQEMKNKPPVQAITTQEMNNVIKKLKRNKATGPDDIPNEIFKEADPETKELYLDIVNDIAKRRDIPENWQEGEIKRLYKGKGQKGKCSNERGITLSSNFGKVFERIINERAIKQVKMSEMQAGGSKGRATVDHILIMKEVITYLKNHRKNVYIAFLDVTKAYDKAWLDAIMYVMYKQGLRDNTWSIVRQLNENLTARIETKYGKTRKIRITDSIRQGGVLSVLQYALLMDEISKEVQEKGQGVHIEEIDETIGCLLWMDDVLLIAPETKMMDEMLKTTNHIASIYHIEFGQAKSNVMKVGKRGNKEEMEMGQMKMDYTKKYKYLGLTQNETNNLEDHLRNTRAKVEAAYQTIMAIAADSVLINLELETIWRNIEICIIPTIIYSGEVWKITKGEKKQINRMLEGIIKRVLMVPTSTPREALYIETGLLDPDTLIKRNRVMMQDRIRKGETTLTKKIIEHNQKGGWKEYTENIKQEMKITDDEMIGKKDTIKKIVGKKTKAYFKEMIDKEGKDKSKVGYLLQGYEGEWKPGVRQPYLNQLTRKQASIIFKARTRMIDVKNNFRGKYQNNLCRLCNETNETQEHVMEECKIIHRNEETKVRKSDLFNKTTEELRETAKKVENIIKIIEKAENTEQNKTRETNQRKTTAVR